MITLLFILLFQPPQDLADWRFRSYTSDDGLAHETVLAVHRDRRGFVWIGTMGGLFRFDGRRFDTFLSDPDDSLSLSDSFIHGFHEDADGYLWISTRNGGVNRYDWRTDTFQRHLPGQHIQFLSADAEGTLWAGVYRTGLVRFDRDAGTFVPVESPHILFFGMASFPGGPTWFLTDGGLVSLDPYEVIVAPTWIENAPVFLSSDPRGDVHIYQPNHVFLRVDRPAGVAGTQVLVTPSRMLPTHEPDMYIFGTDLGTIGKLFYPFGIIQEQMVPGAEGSTIHAIHRDADAHIWIGTWGKGLRHVLPNAKFRKSVHADGDNFVLSMLEPTPGTLWVGTSRGVREGDRKLRFRLANGRILSEFVPYVMHRNNLGAWIGTQHDGLIFVPESELGKSGDVLNAIQHTDLPQLFIRAIRTEASGRMWIGTENNGICIIEDPAEMRCERISSELSDDDIRFILLEKPGVAWVSTFRGGVNRVEWPSRRVTVIPQPGGNGAGLTLQDSTALWIANYGAGLTRVDLRDQSTRLFTTRDGLPVNSLYGHLLDDQGALWISTNKGLSRLDTRTFTFRNFTQDDGLQSNEFNTGAYLALSDGSLAFGGVGGVNRFRPADIRDNPRMPHVQITQIRLFDRPLQSNLSPVAIDTIRLTYKDHFLSFELAALEFTDPERNRFAYRMIGLDEDWIDAGTRNYVSYPNLSPGEYVFEVKATNNDGVWSETPRRITILISPPFWKTPWFIVLSGLTLIVGFTWLIRDISTRKLKAEMKIQNERERISRDLHDHVGAQLVNILSGLDLAGRDPSRSEQILTSVREEAQTTIRQLRDTIWTLKSVAITPEAFITQVERYVRQLEQISAMPVDLRTEISVAHALSPAVALNAFRILQEALQNVLKHSGAAKADVDIHFSADGLRIRIIDNGRFREPDTDSPDGSGLGNMRKRAEEVGGDVRIDGTPTGTTVELHVAIA